MKTQSNIQLSKKSQSREFAKENPVVRELKSNPHVQGAALEIALLHLRFDDEGNQAEKLENACTSIHNRCCAELGIPADSELGDAELDAVNGLAFKVKDAVLKSLGNPRLAEVNLRSFLRSN